MHIKLLEYIQNNIKKLLFINIPLVLLLYILLVIPLRIHFDVPLEGINSGDFYDGAIDKKFSKSDEMFFSNLNNITKENDFIEFDENVRVGINVMLGNDDYNHTRNYGVISFTGKFKNQDSKYEFLKYLGVKDEQIEEYKENNETSFDVSTEVAYCYISECENNKVVIIIEKQLPEDYYRYAPGNTIKDLDEQTTKFGYILTVNRIISRKIYFKCFIIRLIELIVIIFINCIFYLIQKLKAKLKSKKKKES